MLLDRITVQKSNQIKSKLILLKSFSFSSLLPFAPFSIPLLLFPLFYAISTHFYSIPFLFSYVHDSLFPPSFYSFRSIGKFSLPAIICTPCHLSSHSPRPSHNIFIFSLLSECQHNEISSQEQKWSYGIPSPSRSSLPFSLPSTTSFTSTKK